MKLKNFSETEEKRAQEHLEQTNLFAAGIDIGSHEHYVAVPESLDENPIRSFSCFTSDLEEMADWLVKIGITTVKGKKGVSQKKGQKGVIKKGSKKGSSRRLTFLPPYHILFYNSSSHSVAVSTSSTPSGISERLNGTLVLKQLIIQHCPISEDRQFF